MSSVQLPLWTSSVAHTIRTAPPPHKVTQTKAKMSSIIRCTCTRASNQEQWAKATETNEIVSLFMNDVAIDVSFFFHSIFFLSIQHERGKRPHNNKRPTERFEAVQTSDSLYYAGLCTADAHHRLGSNAFFGQSENRQSPVAFRKEN